MVALIAGGTISQWSGGKFANGAVSAAFTHLFNAEARKKIVTIKTRVGSVYQVQGSFGKKVFSIGVSISPGYREYNLSERTSYEGGNVSAQGRIGPFGSGRGWTRQGNLNWEWGEYPTSPNTASVSLGFIVGGTAEFDYGQAWSNFVDAWNNTPLFVTGPMSDFGPGKYFD